MRTNVLITAFITFRRTRERGSTGLSSINKDLRTGSYVLSSSILIGWVRRFTLSLIHMTHG